MGRVEGASEAPARPVDREKNGRGVYLIIKHGPPRHSLVRYVPCPTRPGLGDAVFNSKAMSLPAATHTKHDALFLPDAPGCFMSGLQFSKFRIFIVKTIWVVRMCHFPWNQP